MKNGDVIHMYVFASLWEKRSSTYSHPPFSVV
jgi:hypothetical protein